MSQLPLRGRVYAVTGAGKGLGRAYALQLAGFGAKVIVNNRTHEGVASTAQATVESIRQAGGEATHEHSDVTDPECGERLLEAALTQFGRLDGIIANAGVSEGKSFHKQTASEFKSVVEPNLFGTVNTVQPAFRYFYANGGGRILVSTSGAGLYGEHGLPGYSTAKAALLGLMYALHHEGVAKSIFVNAIAPYAATQMTEAHLPEGMAAMLQPEQVAPIAAWLMSPGCAVSGDIIVAGAGRISRAGMLETPSVALEYDGSLDSLQERWNELSRMQLSERHAGAREHFAAFALGQKG